MKIVRFDIDGHCQYVYFNWRKFRFECSCWAESIEKLIAPIKGSNHLIIGLWRP